MELFLGIFVIVVIFQVILQVILEIFLNKIPEDKPSLIAKTIAPIFIVLAFVLILFGVALPFLSIGLEVLALPSILTGAILLPFSVSYYRQKYTIPKYKQNHQSSEETRKQVNDLETKSSEKFQAKHFQ